MDSRGLRNLRIEHVGVAVADLAAAQRHYEDILGLERVHEETVGSQGVRVSFHGHRGALVELLQPTSPESPVGRFLAKRGPGVHHLAYAVDDIEAALQAARAAGLTLVDEKPRRGARGHLVAFLHPRSTFGVLTEFVQEDSA